MKEKIKRKFIEIFGDGDIFNIKSPGRVNLIGEHTDYQGGYVLPIAINKYIYFCGRKRKDKKIKIYSFNYDDYLEVDIPDIKFNKEKKWANYIFGVIKEFEKSKIDISGFEVAYGGNIPVGSGLSSSASVEIGTISLLMKTFNIKIPDIQVINIARCAENNFVGVNCGIMDQFIIYLGKKDNAIFLNCNNLNYSYVPFKTGEYQLLLVDTKKERTLSNSVYNERVKEVGEVVNIIKKFVDIDNLGQISPEILEKYKSLIGQTEYMRSKHIVEENERVKKSVELLKNGEIEKFGELLYSSHKSLKELYNVSCNELDFIVDFSKNFEGVAGSRLTGAGLGGCCIVLIKKIIIEEFKEKLESAYFEKFKLKPAFYDVLAVDGAKSSI